MISFTLSVSDRNFIRDSSEPYQIMPVQRGYLTTDLINTYYQSTEERNILIHTSYMTRAFSQIFIVGFDNKISNLIKQYQKLAKRINTKYILVHGPSSKTEMENFEISLQKLKQLFENEKDLILCIEIPSMTKAFLKEIEGNYFNFFNNYVQKIVSYGFQIVFDTAHCFNNGLTNEEIIELMNKYKNNYDWVHLNGNCRPRISSDKHVPMFDKTNKIEDYENFSKQIIELNKFNISETIIGSYDQWKTFSESVKGSLITEKAFKHL